MTMISFIFKLLFFTYLLSVSVRSYLDPQFWSLINNVNLIFHEAGHVFLLPFGKFMHFFGGTLFEFGIPLFLTLYFAFKRQWYGAVFTAWWLSTAFYGISLYAGDAVSRVMPLLGGEAVEHDWYTMLSMLNWLKYTDQVAGFFLNLSIISLCLSVFFLHLDWRATSNAENINL